MERVASQCKNDVSEALIRLGLFLSGDPNDPASGLAWCFTCAFPNQIVKHLDGLGWLGHRNGHVLEPIPQDEFPDLAVEGFLGRIARATYQYVRAKLQPEDLVLAIARFNGLLDETPKPKHTPRCGSCAYFETPACSSPTPMTVTRDGSICRRFYPFNDALKAHRSELIHQRRVKLQVEALP